MRERFHYSNTQLTLRVLTFPHMHIHTHALTHAQLTAPNAAGAVLVVCVRVARRAMVPIRCFISASGRSKNSFFLIVALDTIDCCGVVTMFPIEVKPEICLTSVRAGLGVIAFGCIASGSHSRIC